MSVSVELPEGLLVGSKEDRQMFTRQVLIYYTLGHLDEQGKISSGLGAKVLDCDRWEFYRLLSENGFAVIDYPADELADEAQTSRAGKRRQSPLSRGATWAARCPVQRPGSYPLGGGALVVEFVVGLTFPVKLIADAGPISRGHGEQAAASGPVGAELLIIPVTFPVCWDQLVGPYSGTGQLANLSGKMTISIKDDEHTYEFDYTLPLIID